MNIVIFNRAVGYNIGDTIQSIALARLIEKPFKGVPRNQIPQLTENDDMLLVNGWQHMANEAGKLPSLFAGVHVPTTSPHEIFDWVCKSPKVVGTRDPVTQSVLWRYGVDTKLIGCSCITLPYYEGPRSGVYYVDLYPAALARFITHDLPLDIDGRAQGLWNIGLDLLNQYRTAEIVYTRRLHVALPCIAFGTPVVIACPDDDLGRFSILYEMGVPLSKPYVATEKDRMFWRERYLQHLFDLGVAVKPIPLEECLEVPPNWR